MKGPKYDRETRVMMLEQTVEKLRAKCKIQKGNFMLYKVKMRQQFNDLDQAIELLQNRIRLLEEKVLQEVAPSSSPAPEPTNPPITESVNAVPVVASATSVTTLVKKPGAPIIFPATNSNNTGALGVNGVSSSSMQNSDKPTFEFKNPNPFAAIFVPNPFTKASNKAFDPPIIQSNATVPLIDNNHPDPQLDKSKNAAQLPTIGSSNSNALVVNSVATPSIFEKSKEPATESRIFNPNLRSCIPILSLDKLDMHCRQGGQTVEPEPPKVTTKSQAQEIVEPESPKVTTKSQAQEIVEPESPKVTMKSQAQEIVEPEPRKVGRKSQAQQPVEREPRKVAKKSQARQIVQPEPRKVGRKSQAQQPVEREPRKVAKKSQAQEIVEPEPRKVAKKLQAQEIVEPEPRKVAKKSQPQGIVEPEPSVLATEPTESNEKMGSGTNSALDDTMHTEPQTTKKNDIEEKSGPDAEKNKNGTSAPASNDDDDDDEDDDDDDDDDDDSTEDDSSDDEMDKKDPKVTLVRQPRWMTEQRLILGTLTPSPRSRSVTPSPAAAVSKPTPGSPRRPPTPSSKKSKPGF